MMLVNPILTRNKKQKKITVGDVDSAIVFYEANLSTVVLGKLAMSLRSNPRGLPELEQDLEIFLGQVQNPYFAAFVVDGRAYVTVSAPAHPNFKAYKEALNELTE